MLNNQVILVNEKDEAVGSVGKLEAHRRGMLHRAFSVFILNNEEEMLLHQRAEKKYHSGGLWTNACCSHPQPGEDIEQAAHRRLQEELGFDCRLIKVFDFIYRENMDNGLIEHEFDHVFVGYYDGNIIHNEEEISNYGYLSFPAIRHLLDKQPDQFTAWFKIAFPKVESFIRSMAVVY